jgi:septal ring factor EnvC (AmiA/AmiB activator)
LRNQINELQKDLTKLKADYGLLVYQSYKTRNQTDQWMYIFSADDFYQAFNRIKYIKAIGETRKEAAARIYEKETSLQSQINRLENVKKDRLNLMTAKEQEAKSLISDKSHKEAAVTGIIKKEKELKQQLATQQKEWKKLNDEIKRIIEASMKKTTVTVKGKTTETKKIPLTPEETTLASNFAGNKGKLPWPSERGQIISSFGPHPHPQLHVTIDNKGIDIRTERGTKARAVYAGKVNRIIQIGKYKAILIQHGSYFTVYSNLSVVYVSENENVATKQVIGLIATSSDSDETILHFELWSSQTNTPLNPEYWINK